MERHRGTCQPQELPAGPGKAVPGLEKLPRLRTPGIASLVCATIVSLRVVRASVSPQGICTVVQVGESSCVLGLRLQAGLRKGNKEAKGGFSYFFIIIFFKFVNNFA